MMALFRRAVPKRAIFRGSPWLPCWLAILGLGGGGSAFSRGDESSTKSRSKSAAKAKADRKEKPSVEKPDDDATPVSDDNTLETDEDLTALVVPDGSLTKLKSSE